MCRDFTSPLCFTETSFMPLISEFQASVKIFVANKNLSQMNPPFVLWVGFLLQCSFFVSIHLLNIDLCALPSFPP